MKHNNLTILAHSLWMVFEKWMGLFAVKMAQAEFYDLKGSNSAEFWETKTIKKVHQHQFVFTIWNSNIILNLNSTRSIELNQWNLSSFFCLSIRLPFSFIINLNGMHLPICWRYDIWNSLKRKCYSIESIVEQFIDWPSIELRQRRKLSYDQNVFTQIG